MPDSTAPSGTILPTSDTIKQVMQQIQPYLTPAAVGAGVGAGTLGLASLMGPKLHNPAARRAMLLRNMAMGGLFGAGAGAAVPLARDFISTATPPPNETSKVLSQVAAEYTQPGASSLPAVLGYGAMGGLIPRLWNLGSGNSFSNRQLADTNAARLIQKLEGTWGEMQKNVQSKIDSAFAGSGEGKGKGKNTSGAASQKDVLSRLASLLHSQGGAPSAHANVNATGSILDKINALKQEFLNQSARTDPGLKQLAMELQRKMPNYVLNPVTPPGAPAPPPTTGARGAMQAVWDKMRGSRTPVGVRAGNATIEQIMAHLAEHLGAGSTNQMQKGMAMPKYGNGVYGKANLKTLDPIREGGPGWQPRFSARPVTTAVGAGLGAGLPLLSQLLPGLYAGGQTLRASID